REAGIEDIVIVVGYLKEKFDYLIDKYGVKLIYNPEYAVKNNFVSLYCAREHLKRTYICVADHWIEGSVFHQYEPCSWLSCVYHEGKTNEWGVSVGAANRITKMRAGAEDSWILMGPVYVDAEASRLLAGLLESYYENPGADNYYFEDIIREHLSDFTIFINKQDAANIYEFESLEDLRRYDETYRTDSGNEIMQKIAAEFGVAEQDISGIRPLKEGMTNSSFVFKVAGESYVFRIPGAGTDMLIDRAQEKRTYELIAPLDVSDEIILFERDSGIKISRYYENARVTDPENEEDVREVMRLLRTIHEADIVPDHSFGIEHMIDFYEKLANERDAILFEDYAEVRIMADRLIAKKKEIDIPETLCHIDYVFANLLRLPDGSIRVIDWEYSGGGDPLIDIAMFSIYAYYDRAKVDRAVRFYLDREPARDEQARVYMYVALGGFLWSLWCEYKQSLGDEFGEYPMIQYRYMKDFYHILESEGLL
ncbi:MAG: phosphotransferase, partial [Clostridiales Family XIII bacterium]|nr:phosphotransferase [Clostridiales Family XIII bacterium]